MHLHVKKLFLILFVYVIFQNISCTESATLSTTATGTTTQAVPEDLTVQISAKPQEYSKLKALMLCIGDNEAVTNLAKIVKYDLEFSDQMDIDLKKTNEEPNNKVLSKLFSEGVSLFISVKSTDFLNKSNIEIILKEPSTGSTLFNKAFAYSKDNYIRDAHAISDKLMPVLTGQKGPMLSTLAYCKQISPSCKALCISDYACKQERVLYSSRMINLAPRWHTQVPTIFFSQLTKQNARLMSLDIKTNKTKIICSYEGLNMQPSFSEDGSKAVLCLSGRKNSELYLYDQALFNKYKKKMFIQLTSNNGNNASPCLLPNGDVVFCSDYETGNPQIYYLNTKNKKTTRLTNGGGYCAAPSYCKANNSIVYCRIKDGFIQLFTMELGKGMFVEKQITKDPHNKQEPVWSECGNYIAFSTDCFNIKSGKNIPQIGILNVRSSKIRVVTSDDKIKSFPCWTNKTYYC